MLPYPDLDYDSLGAVLFVWLPLLCLAVILLATLITGIGEWLERRRCPKSPDRVTSDSVPE